MLDDRGGGGGGAARAHRLNREERGVGEWGGGVCRHPVYKAVSVHLNLFPGATAPAFSKERESEET